MCTATETHSFAYPTNPYLLDGFCGLGLQYTKGGNHFSKVHILNRCNRADMMLPWTQAFSDMKTERPGEAPRAVKSFDFNCSDYGGSEYPSRNSSGPVRNDIPFPEKQFFLSALTKTEFKLKVKHSVAGRILRKAAGSVPLVARRNIDKKANHEVPKLVCVQSSNEMSEAKKLTAQSLAQEIATSMMNYKSTSESFRSSHCSMFSDDGLSFALEQSRFLNQQRKLGAKKDCNLERSFAARVPISKPPQSTSPYARAA